MELRQLRRRSLAEAVWSTDFTADQLVHGDRMRLPALVDVFALESLAIELGPRLRSTKYAAERANSGQKFSG